MKKDNKLPKVGLFGASFNPLHLAHLNVIIGTQEKFCFDVLKVVPAFKAPRPGGSKRTKIIVKEPGPSERFDIVKNALRKLSFVEVDDQEIKRKGISYSYLTVSHISGLSKECFLVIGLDQMAVFHKWKNYKDILKLSHLVVCSRKPYVWPDHLPQDISDKVVKKFKNKLVLNTGKSIHYLPLNDMDISASLIRKRLSCGLRGDHMLPAEVNQWIMDNRFYQDKGQVRKEAKKNISVKKGSFKNPDEKLINICVSSLMEKKAENIKVLDLRHYPGAGFSYFIVASGLNEVHTKALARQVHTNVKKEKLPMKFRQEGLKTGQWIVLDYKNVLVHIFYDYIRSRYDLENLWDKAKVEEISSEKSKSLSLNK